MLVVDTTCGARPLLYRAFKQDIVAESAWIVVIGLLFLSFFVFHSCCL